MLIIKPICAVLSAADSGASSSEIVAPSSQSLIRCLDTLFFPADLSPEAYQSIWSQLLDLYSGALLTDWYVLLRLSDMARANPFARLFPVHSSIVDTLSLKDQATDESFDLRYLSSLETDLIPIIGSSRVPDHLIVKLARVLQQASRFYRFETDGPVPSSPELGEQRAPAAGEELYGTTAEIVGLPKERFRRWCFDVLFMLGQRVETSESALSPYAHVASG